MPTEAGDDLNRSLVMALACAIQGLRQQMHPLFAADGLTVGQFDTLRVLYLHGSLSIGDLLDKTLTTSGNIDVVLGNLLAKKLIDRTLDPADKRRRIVALTRKGRAYIARCGPVYDRELRRLLSVISIRDRRTLQGLLSRLGEGLSRRVS